MGQIGQILTASTQLSLQYAERLLNGIRAEQFARFARPGGTLLSSNHGAFVLGHLSLYPARAVAAIGLPAGETAYPPHFEALFKNGVECKDDADGRLYPKMEELTTVFFRTYRAAIQAVSAAPDEPFLKPNPAEGRMRELFPVIGGAIGFYLGGHMQNHLGQMSAWRRALGLPAA